MGLVLLSAGIVPAEEGESGSSPVFSVSRGFYREPFALTIRALDQAPIKYTLDGSDPRTSAAARQVDTPFELWVDPFDLTGRHREIVPMLVEIR